MLAYLVLLGIVFLLGFNGQNHNLNEKSEAIAPLNIYQKSSFENGSFLLINFDGCGGATVGFGFVGAAHFLAKI